jgi:peptidoglycan/xylan/chitin deacetylase (PgdA/CDA1 family)
MRLDRFLTLHLFHQLRKIPLRSNGIHIPILMYHGISNEPESGHPYYRINTTPTRFSEHMKYLHDNKYHVISLSEAARLLSPNASTTQRPDDLVTLQPGDPMTQRFNDSITQRPRYIVLTFDDGFADFHTEAFPILQKHGATATVFLPTGFISDPGRGFKNKKCLNWDEVRDLAASGIEFGSHTVTHPILSKLHWELVESEIKESKKNIEDNIGTQVESFSYPYAFPEENKQFVRSLKNLLQGTGYTYGVTTKIGISGEKEDPFFLKRIPVNDCDDIRFLEAKIKGAYDWIYQIQRLYKNLRRPKRR